MCLRGAQQLWSQNLHNYVTVLLPPNCLAKPRSHLQDALGRMTSCSPISGGDAGLLPASSGAASPSHLAPAWSSPAVAAAPWHGHRSACQPEQGACTPTPAAHLLPPRAQRDHRAEQSWGCSSRAGWCFPSPKVPAAYPGDGHLCWILSITRAEKHEWLLRGLAWYIKGDYPVPTHFCSDNIVY